jgi:flagellar basal-body rod protein FlgG
MEQGNLAQTDSPYDLAIEGRGFFRIQMPSGDFAYTRAGSYQLSPQGQLVTSEGFVVSPGITIPPDATGVSINDQGVVQVTTSGQTAPQQIGQLELASFANEAGLQALGDNKFSETAASGTATVGVPGAAGLGTISQHFLETSNVNAVSEITNLITAQRAYEMNSKVISTADEMMSATTNIK